MRFFSIRSVTCFSMGCLALACGASTTENNPTNMMGTAGTPGASGTTGNAGGTGQGVAGSGGATNPGGGGANVSGGAGGAAQGGAAQGGAAQGGAAQGGAGGAAGGAGGEAGAAQGGEAGAAQGGAPGTDDCGAPIPPPISTLITAGADYYQHTVGGRPAAVDLRAPIIMGKLIVDMGVSSGGIYGFGVDRGFHTYGGEIQANGQQCTIDQGCPAGGWDSTAHNGDCRWNTFDGMPHGDSSGDTPETSLSGAIKAMLQELSVNAPGQGWDYFLDTNGEVRWSDVGFTGYSHGAQTAALIATKQCVYRAVSRSGPRDNGCGTGQADGDYDPNNPPWDPNCMGCISDWLDETPASPISHFYGFVGKTDGQYGDIMFSMERMGFVGDFVNISTTDPGDSHRFYADAGHGGFDEEQYWPALQKAWGVPDENMTYAAGL